MDFTQTNLGSRGGTASIWTIHLEEMVVWIHGIHHWKAMVETDLMVLPMRVTFLNLSRCLRNTGFSQIVNGNISTAHYPYLHLTVYTRRFDTSPLTQHAMGRAR
jgi:hypothetical protein